MDNGHKILGGLLAITVIIILLMRSCGSGDNSNPCEEVVKIITKDSTVIKYKWYDTTLYKNVIVRVPIPYYDTIDVYNTTEVPLYSAEDFDQIMRFPAIYEDSVSDDTVSIKYKATIRGYLDKLEIGYKIYKPYSIVETRIIETETTKIKESVGFYMGLDAGANLDGATYFAPMAEIVAPKMTYNAGFDIINRSVIIGVRTRISFRKKPKTIPRS